VDGESKASELEWSAEEMRRLGYQVVDDLVERWSTLGEGQAWAGGTRRELEPLLLEDAPEEGRGAEAVLERVRRDVLPRAGRIDHPRFFAFIPSSPTWPALMGELMATGYNVFQGTWLESAGPSQLELVVMEWFRSWIGLPRSGGGLLTSGGSAANLVALVTAREWAGNPTHGTLYLSDQGHSSLERAARIMGIREENLRRVATDASFRMDPKALREAVQEDRKAGHQPFCVCANAGATNTGAIDPLDEVARVAREEGLWYHVDGAYGGFAALLPEWATAFRGMEDADSITLDPHKWFFQPYETGCLMVRDTGVLEDAFRILPEYLQDVDLGREQVNFADRGLQLTRRFRALNVWVAIQVHGMRAIREAIRIGIRLAEKAKEYVEGSQELEITGGTSLGVICFQYRPPGRSMTALELEELNQAIQDRILAEGLAMMSSTRLKGLFSLRLCILNYRSTWEDVLAVLQVVEEKGRVLAPEGGAR
jgi:glutamate/tyrosine decarboxylase-like PLP-dependent enzyme